PGSCKTGRRHAGSPDRSFGTLNPLWSHLQAASGGTANGSKVHFCISAKTEYRHPEGREPCAHTPSALTDRDNGVAPLESLRPHTKTSILRSRPRRRRWLFDPWKAPSFS